MKKSFGVIVVALVAAMSFAGVALADEVDDDSESQMMTPVVVVDEETGLVTIAIPIDGELPEGCIPDDSASTEEPEEDAVDGDDGDESEDPDEAVSYGPGDCIEFVIDHPSGKTHHGAVVSTVAKNLHPSMLDGIKKGEIMRMVAKTGKMADDGDDDGDDGEVKEKADKEIRKAEKAERKAQRKAELEERKAQRKADQAARKADRAANKANRGKNNR